MKESEPGSGAFLNECIEEAWSVIEEAVREVAERYTSSGFTITQEPITFKKLQDLPFEEARTVIANMIRQPFYRDDGMKYAAKVYDALEAQNG